MLFQLSALLPCGVSWWGEGKQPNLSVVVKAKTCLFFSDKLRDRKCTKPFDKKLVLRQASSERDLDGCFFGRADVTNMAPSCQVFPSPGGSQCPSHTSVIHHSISANRVMSDRFLFSAQRVGILSYLVCLEGSGCWHADVSGRYGLWIAVSEYWDNLVNSPKGRNWW